MDLNGRLKMNEEEGMLECYLSAAAAAVGDPAGKGL